MYSDSLHHEHLRGALRCMVMHSNTRWRVVTNCRLLSPHKPAPAPRVALEVGHCHHKLYRPAVVFSLIEWVMTASTKRVPRQLPATGWWPIVRLCARRLHGFQTGSGPYHAHYEGTSTTSESCHRIAGGGPPCLTMHRRLGDTQERQSCSWRLCSNFRIFIEFDEPGSKATKHHWETNTETAGSDK